MRTETLPPGIHGPSLRWYRPSGLAYWAVRSTVRFWVTGRPVWGRGDNATFLRDATVDHRGGPRERLTRARWRRLAWRWGVVGVPVLLWALVGFWAVLGYLMAAAGAGGYLGWKVWRAQAELRTYVYPAGRVLARITGVRYSRAFARSSIRLPASGTTVRVYVPDIELSPGTKRRIADGVGGRLGLREPGMVWTEAGTDRAYVDLSPVAPAVASVSLAGLLDEIKASPIGEPVVGVANGARVVHMDFRNDSPHTLGSAASGAGKSTLYKFIAMQRLAHGAYAIILDFKKWSHLRWAGRLTPGRVLIEDQVPRIHDVLVRVLDELLWRKSFGLDQEDELDDLPTVDVYVEEINTLMSLLVDYWREHVAREKAAARTALRQAKMSEDEDAILQAEEDMSRAMGLPVTSPAVQALRYGVNLGREFRYHFHFIGQSMSAKAAGGRDTRESFRTRLLARWDRKTWKMLADGVDYVACPDAPVGIWAHVHGGQVDIVRVPHVDDAEAVAFIGAGRVPTRPLFHGDPMPPLEGTHTPAIDRPMPLSEAIGYLPYRPSLESLRKKVQRAALKPAVRAPAGGVSLYLLADLEALYAAS